jgi:hypothetical protein
MYEELTRRHFDVAGVKQGEREPVCGLVRRDQLRSMYVRDHIEPLSDRLIVDESIGIEPLLTRLRDQKFVFVAVNNLVGGILTLADLNKPLVRTYFFGLLSLLEIHLSFWVAQTYSSETWKAELTPERVETAIGIRDERRRRGQNLHLIDCLQFSDKAKLVLERDSVRISLGLGSKTKVKRYLSNAENLRNTLAHSLYNLAEGANWIDLIDLIQWVMTVLAASDAVVEKQAADVSQNYISGLWSPV